MNEFEELGLIVSAGVRMPIIYPGTQFPVKDETGQQGYIEYLSLDSDVGRSISKNASDRVLRQLQGAVAEEIDVEKRNIETLAALTTGWHLVGPPKDGKEFGRVINVPFSREAAIRLYSAPATSWLFRRGYAWVNNDANFMKRSSFD